MNQQPENLPASAKRFADVALAAGATVTYDAGYGSWSVDVTTLAGSHAVVVWSLRNTAAANSRLGFVTDFKEGVRFDYASVHLAYPIRLNGKDTRYPTVASVAKVRQYLAI